MTAQSEKGSVTKTDIYCTVGMLVAIIVLILWWIRLHEQQTVIVINDPSDLVRKPDGMYYIKEHHDIKE